MTVNDLIGRLENLSPDKEIRFYYLKEYSLTSCHLETILDMEEMVELTIQNEHELYERERQ